MVQSKDELYSPPRIRIHVTEPGASIRRGCVRCEIDKNVEFSTDRLETYCIAKWNPIVYDALLVAAAAEFGDRIQRRPSLSWRRDIELMIPVHGPERWREKAVSESLHDALNFLTGIGGRSIFANESNLWKLPVKGSSTYRRIWPQSFHSATASIRAASQESRRAKLETS